MQRKGFLVDCPNAAIALRVYEMFIKHGGTPDQSMRNRCIRSTGDFVLNLKGTTIRYGSLSYAKSEAGRNEFVLFNYTNDIEERLIKGGIFIIYDGVAIRVYNPGTAKGTISILESLGWNDYYELKNRYNHHDPDWAYLWVENDDSSIMRSGEEWVEDEFEVKDIIILEFSNDLKDVLIENGVRYGG